MTIEEWLGKDNQLGIDIWNKKYRFNNETFDEWLDRVSGGAEKLRNAIIEKRFLFGGRILANRGLADKGQKVTYSNCYVIAAPEDNLESIFDCGKKLARTYSYGGGCGIDLGKLAPRGAKVHNAAKESSGAVSFMDLYSMITGLISQNGRRGALMISMPITHPDIEEFIDIKNDLERITKANISIRVTNAFMNAVERDEDFELSFIREETGEKISKTVRARDLFNRIAENNWNMGEPGMLFWDRIRRWNMLYGHPGFEYAGVNPCFTGDMELLTADGYASFESLAAQCEDGSTISVVGIDGLRSDGRVWCNGEKDVVDVVLANGRRITCTPDHTFMTADGEECKARDLAGKNVAMFDGRTVRAVSVNDAGQRLVYDFSEPRRHWGVVNGCIVHNCAEEPLPAGGSCLLGSINLDAFVENGRFNYKRFADTVDLGVRALNCVLDEGIPLHPLPEQRESVRDWRQIGLGIMGLADALIHMGTRYGSSEAVAFCSVVSHQMLDAAVKTSAQLAKSFGSYPKIDMPALADNEFLGNAELGSVCANGILNSQLLTIPPTGTLSTMLGISGGIEPIFANYYTRRTESLHGEEREYKVYTPIVQRYMDGHGLTDDAGLPDYFVTAQTLGYRERIDMQAAWQENIDASISSTVNVPESFTVEQVSDLYLYAWKKGLKGITIFRNNCKRLGILTTPPSKQEDEKPQATEIPRGYIESVPEGINYRKYKLTTGCGKLYLFVGIDEATNRIYDFFTNTDGVGGCTVNTQANSRLMSACIRGGVPVEYVIEQLRKSGTCPSFQYQRGKGKQLSEGKSCPGAIANVLSDVLRELNGEEDGESAVKPELSVADVAKSGVCPDCGSADIAFEGGCVTCKNCGYSKCG